MATGKFRAFRAFHLVFPLVVLPSTGPYPTPSPPCLQKGATSPDLPLYWGLKFLKD